MSTAARKAAIRTLRAEGAEAYANGWHAHNNPHTGHNAAQWLAGYEEAHSAALATAHESRQATFDSEGAYLRTRILTALTEYTTQPNELATHRLSRLLAEWEAHIVETTRAALLGTQSRS